MTTKQKDKSNNNINDVRSVNLPALYKIDYPNSRRGMFSLRAPFKESYLNENQQKNYTSKSTSNSIHPEYLHVDQNQPVYQQFPQRDAQVQCSLIEPNSDDEVILRRRRQPTFVADSYNYGYLSPRYRVQLQLQPTQPNIYEVWNVETPPPRSIPINEPIRHRERSIHVRSPHLVSIKSLSDDESDYDDGIVYAHYPPLPPPPIYYSHPQVRMVCVRQDANTICY